jgi:hypothetical protein
MAQQITKTLLQNSSVVGLKLTETIVNVVNNIDQELNRKANDTDLRLVLDEVTLKPSTKDVEKLMKTVLDRYDGLVEKRNNRLVTKQSKMSLRLCPTRCVAMTLQLQITKR